MRKLNINKNFLFSAGKTFQVALDYIYEESTTWLSGYLTYENSLYRKNSGKQTEGRQEITLASRWEGFSGTCAW